jgi:hypothetical protein
VPHGHKQYLRDNVSCLTALQRAANDRTRVEINHESKIGEVLKLDDLGYLGAVGRVHVERPVQCIMNITNDLPPKVASHRL